MYLEDYITIKHLMLYKFSITENMKKKGLLIKWEIDLMNTLCNKATYLK